MKIRNKIMKVLYSEPYLIGRDVGFSKLNKRLHNEWIKEMTFGENDVTLLAHRGSYKTTCVSISLAILLLLFPSKKIIILRKTDNDVVEIINQVKKILLSDLIQHMSKVLHGVFFDFKTDSKTQIDTTLNQSKSGAVQLLGLGIGTSITGKHADYIFTDDIVNMNDRYSNAERLRTKRCYQELENIKNRGGRIINTGTPWHRDDCISELMVNKRSYDCYSTGLISQKELEKLQKSMSPSLFSANYELKHIADEQLLFQSPTTNQNPTLAEHGYMHLDCAYGGDDFTAMTIGKRHGENYYIFGKVWQKNIQDVEDEIIHWHSLFKAGKSFCESNADKGFVAKELKSKGIRMVTYHEKMNKHLKIVTYLKREWANVCFVKGTDKEYISQITDYSENAEHDDAPDSLASLLRWYGKRESYKPIIY